MNFLANTSKALIFIAFFVLFIGAGFLRVPRAGAVAGHIETLEASQVSATEAMVSGSMYFPEMAVLPNSPFGHEKQVAYRFSFGPDSTLTSADHTSFSLAGDTSRGVTVSTSLVGLAAATTYYYRFEVTLPTGFVMVGAIKSFTTGGNQGGVAIAATLPAGATSDTTVILRGRFNPQSATPQYWFEYSLNPSMAFSAATPFHTSANLADYVDVADSVSGLTANRTYFYRLAVQTVSGTVYGGVMSFHTAAIGVSSGATYSGSYTGGGQAQTVYPSYGAITELGYARVATGGSSGVLSAARGRTVSAALPSSNSKKTVATAVSGGGGYGNVGAGIYTASLTGVTDSRTAQTSSCLAFFSNTDTPAVKRGSKATISLHVQNGCGAMVRAASLSVSLDPRVSLLSSETANYTKTGDTIVYALGDMVTGAGTGVSFVVQTPASAKASESGISFPVVLTYQDSRGVAHRENAAVEIVFEKQKTISASLLGSSGGFTGNSLFVLLLLVVLGTLLFYKFFMPKKKQHGGHVTKLGTLHIID